MGRRAAWRWRPVRPFAAAPASARRDDDPHRAARNPLVREAPFIDPHCDQNGCADFHYGTYVTSLSAMTEPGSLGMGVAVPAILAASARRRRPS